MNRKLRNATLLANCASKLLGLIALIAVTLSLALPSLAQTSKGAITGTVVDQMGASVVGATVTATNKEHGTVRTATSGPSGGYFMDAMDLGTYKVTFDKSGFQTLTVDNVTVRAAVQTSVDGRIGVGTKQEVINVESTGATVQTDNAEISHNISTIEVTDLPFASLNPIELVLTEPGMADVNQNGRGTSNGFNFAANGLTPRENNFLLDGQDNNDNSIQGQAFQPSNPNAIQEVSILTNSYSAEFGRGGSTVTNLIYKGGTNKFHGSAWELYQGSGLQSIDANLLGAVTSDCTAANLAATGANCKTRFDDHTFGFAAGGPIIKDKLFVFGTSQWFRFYGKASPAVITLPTPAGAAVLAAQGSANANLLLQYLGSLRGDPSNSPTNQTLSNGQVVQFGKVSRPSPAQQNPDTQWNVKVDFLPTQKDTLSVRYLHDRGSLVPDFFNFPASLPGFDTEQGGPAENVVAAYTHVFNSRAVNELRASFGHFDFQFAPTAATLANPLYTLPRFSIAGISGLPGFGVSTALPQGRGHQTYQVQDGLTYTVGRHTFKFGADITRLIIRDEVPFNFFGSETYNKGGGFSALANFVDNFSGGTGTFASKTFGNPTIRPRADQMAYYMEDTWKTTSNLTLTLGLRYEFQPNPENQLAFPGYDLSKGPFGTLTTPVRVKDDGNNFAPRAGIAYSPQFWKSIFGDNKTVIRAGFGMFYDSLYTNIVDNAVASSPNAIAAAANASGPGTTPRGLPNASGAIATLVPVLTPTATQTSVASNMVNPTVFQWNFNIQRELPGKFTMTLAYVGTRGERLFESDIINPFGGFAPGTLNTQPRINPLRGAITVRDNSGDSHYNGGSIKVERQYSHGLLLRGSYTYSKSIDDGSDVFNTFGTGDAGSVTPQNPFSRASNRGLSDFDIRHRAVFAYVWNIPGLHNSSNGLMNGLGYITRGWEVSGTTSLQSGAPVTPFIGGLDTNGDGSAFNGLPFAGTGPKSQVGIDGAFLGPDANTNVPATPGVIYSLNQNNVDGTNVPVTASQVGYIVAPGLGNVGRNSLVAPGSWLQNLAVARHVKIPKMEGHELLLRVEMYNIFNHPNLDNTFGLDSNVLDATNDPNNTYLVNGFAQQGHRDIKLMLKYNF
ncbi:MAG TPA: carboxypeptidase regulatory-like domain-containing protein [Candidatus Angelobacter sp.]